MIMSGQECNHEETEKIVGNPIHNFQLLKRVTVTWKKVVASIEKADNMELVKKLKKLSRKEKLPTDGDLSFAAKSLVNLQEVYNLAASKLADGMLGKVMETRFFGNHTYIDLEGELQRGKDMES